MATCWETLCGADCAYCQYKQARYRKGFGTLCYNWFRENKIPKSCKACAYYLSQREADPSLPQDPSWQEPQAPLP